MSYKDKIILAVITARGGSKRLPRKNIKLLNGKPMIAYAIEAVKYSKYTDRLIVSTDDPEIANISRQYGAETPFIRPDELSNDTASSLAVLQHAVKWTEDKENFKSDIVVLVQPTSPLVLTEDINGTIEKMIDSNTNSCFSVCKITQRPEWMFTVDGDMACPYIEKVSETARSQDFAPLFITNGAVYAMKTDILMKRNMIRDRQNSSAYLMPSHRSVDIDTLTDFKLAELIMKEMGNK